MTEDINSLTEEIKSLKELLKKREHHLLLHDQKRAGFIDPRNVPPDWEVAKKQILTEIAYYKTQLGKAEKVYSKLNQEFRELLTIKVPFVTVAMNNEEAIVLSQGNIFPTDSEDYQNFQSFQANFRQFKEGFPDHYVPDWLSNYKINRNDWEPHACRGKNISEIIWEVTIRLDIERQQKSTIFLPPIQPSFRSEEFFTENTTERRGTWRELRKSGCVLIVDPISLFHPELHNKLLQSNLIGYKERVAILILSPVNFSAFPVNLLLENEFDKRLEMAFDRFSAQWDRLCEFGSGELRALQRWLYATLPETIDIIQKQKPNPSNKTVFRQEMKDSPLGIDNYIFREPRAK